MLHQRTLKRSITCTGRGLHSGKKVVITLNPADNDHGIVFVRTDIKRSIPIKVTPENVIDTKLATTIGKDGVKVSTVEHLLSAIYGMGIDNLLVEVDSPELPIMDGSAAPFVYLIQGAGIERQRSFKRFMLIKRPIRIIEEDRKIFVLPEKRFKITYTIDFQHPLLRNQSFSWVFSDRAFERDIAMARTFCFLKDVERLRSAGLAQGGSLDNAVVLGDYNILNEDGLRYSDEFVRHKILDLLGDLSVLGAYVIGHIKVFKSGHHLNHRLVKELHSNPTRRKVFIPSESEDLDRPEQVPAFKIFHGLRA